MMDDDEFEKNREFVENTILFGFVAFAYIVHIVLIYVLE